MRLVCYCYLELGSPFTTKSNNKFLFRFIVIFLFFLRLSQSLKLVDIYLWKSFFPPFSVFCACPRYFVYTFTVDNILMTFYYLLIVIVMCFFIPLTSFKWMNVTRSHSVFGAIQFSSVVMGFSALFHCSNCRIQIQLTDFSVFCVLQKMFNKHSNHSYMVLFSSDFRFSFPSDYIMFEYTLWAFPFLVLRIPREILKFSTPEMNSTQKLKLLFEPVH